MSEALLRVSAPHFCAGAVWVRRRGRWACKEAAPILEWMVGKDPFEVRQYLLKKGWDFDWLS